MKRKQVKKRRRLNRWIKEAQENALNLEEFCILRKAKLFTERNPVCE